MPWEECVQAADRAPRGSLILIQSTEDGFMDEGQLLRVSVAKALSVCSQSTKRAERHCWSMEHTL